jgi:hypothetical protein
VALVHKRTIPIEGLSLVSNVNLRDLHGRILRFLDRSPYFFLPSSSSVALTRLSGPRFRTTTSQKTWQSWESNPDLWICSQELWPLYHSGCQSHLPFQTKQTCIVTFNHKHNFWALYQSINLLPFHGLQIKALQWHFVIFTSTTCIINFPIYLF